jgi:predicted dehydrogenase
MRCRALAPTSRAVLEIISKSLRLVPFISILNGNREPWSNPVSKRPAESLSMTQRNHHKLRLGIVGAGEVVKRRHLPALQRHPDVEIVAVSNSTYESSEKFCNEHAPHAIPMTNWAELLAIPEIDVVWIGSPPYIHSAVTISALEAGKHVFCQARMAMDLAEAEEMLEVSRRYPELVTMLCPPPHGMRGDLLVQKLLAEEIIGRPHHLRLQSLNSAFLEPDAPAHWRQRIEISGLNVLTLGIYVEVLQHWFGDITFGLARGKIIQPMRQGYEVIIPDLLTVLCTFANEWKVCWSSAESMRTRLPIGLRFTAIWARSPTISALMWCMPARSAIAPCTSSS